MCSILRVNKAKAISAKLLELNLKNKLEETGKQKYETGRNSRTGMIIHGKEALKVNKNFMNRKDEKFNFNPRGRQWGLEERPRTRGL